MAQWLSGSAFQGFAPVIDYAVYGLGVLIVLAIVYWLFRRLGGGTFIAGGIHRHRRLAILDAAAIDTRRRLVLVRRDDHEHLLLIGGATDIVVEQNIDRAGENLAGESGKARQGVADRVSDKAAAHPPEAVSSPPPAAKVTESSADVETYVSAPAPAPAHGWPAAAISAASRSLPQPGQPEREPPAGEPANFRGSQDGRAESRIDEEDRTENAENVAPPPPGTDTSSTRPAENAFTHSADKPAAPVHPARPAPQRQDPAVREKKSQPQALDDEMERLLEELSSGRK